MRAFASIDYPLTQAVEVSSPSIFQLVHHTLRSGALSLCRVWDNNSRSINDVVCGLRNQSVLAKSSQSLAERALLSTLLKEECWQAALMQQDDKSAFEAATQCIEAAHKSLMGCQTHGKLLEFRNKFLAHSTGVAVSDGNRSDYSACKTFLISTLELVDKIQYILENAEQHVVHFHNWLDDGRSDWLENKLIQELS